MSDTRTHYRSSSPEVLTFWSGVEAANDAFRAAVDAYMADYPEHKMVIAQWSDGRKRAAGLEGACPGDAWQKKRGENHWSPKRATSAGRRIVAQLDRIAFAVGEIPGMPAWIFDFPTSGHPGVSFAEGAVWITWGFPPETVEREPRFNPGLWSRVPASEYWLAMETRDREKAEALS